MQVTRLEFDSVFSVTEFYQQLADQITLPPHFGRNLDALFDVLTTELPGPLQIRWHHHEASAVQMGCTHYTALLAVLRDAAACRPEDIKLILD